MVQTSSKFDIIYNKLVVFHDKYEDIIAECDKDAFEIIYTMHHKTDNYEDMKKLFLELFENYGEVLKGCSVELVSDLEQIIESLQ